MKAGQDIDTGNKIRASRNGETVEGFVGSMQYSNGDREVSYFSILDENGDEAAHVNRGGGWRVKVLDRVKRLTKRAPVKPGVCPKCGGKGTIKGFEHIEGGRCFMCDGTGKVGDMLDGFNVEEAEVAEVIEAMADEAEAAALDK
jgi:RecJ-like exonuclease